MIRVFLIILLLCTTSCGGPVHLIPPPSPNAEATPPPVEKPRPVPSPTPRVILKHYKDRYNWSASTGTPTIILSLQSFATMKAVFPQIKSGLNSFVNKLFEQKHYEGFIFYIRLEGKSDPYSFFGPFQVNDVSYKSQGEALAFLVNSFQKISQPSSVGEYQFPYSSFANDIRDIEAMTTRYGSVNKVSIFYFRDRDYTSDLLLLGVQDDRPGQPLDLSFKSFRSTLAGPYSSERFFINSIIYHPDFSRCAVAQQGAAIEYMANLKNPNLFPPSYPTQKAFDLCALTDSDSPTLFMSELAEQVNTLHRRIDFQCSPYQGVTVTINEHVLNINKEFRIYNVGTQYHHTVFEFLEPALEYLTPEAPIEVSYDCAN